MTRNGIRCVFAVLALCALVLFAAPVQAGRAEGTPVAVTLSDDGIIADQPGVYREGGVLTITLPGEYRLKGSLSNGQIIVDCEQNGKVRLYFGGVSVHCEEGPALHIKKCSPRLTIELEEGTVNELSDGAVYANQDKIDAVIYFLKARAIWTRCRMLSGQRRMSHVGSNPAGPIGRRRGQ